MLRVLDLFAGIGGFSLGLERTGGFKTVAFCESAPYPRAVLRRHWPHVPCYDDVRTLDADWLAADGIGVDVVTGGFPCQNLSLAGDGDGLTGEHSGLWGHFARLVYELRPRYVLVENVAALLHRGLGTILGDLAEIGFDCEWHSIPAAALGACHRRDRLFIVAYADGGRCGRIGEPQHALLERAYGHEPDRLGAPGRRTRAPAADTGSRGLALRRRLLTRRQVTDAAAAARLGWPAEPPLCRTDDGIPGRPHRLRALGNAVVPQIVTMIGTAILRSAA